MKQLKIYKILILTLFLFCTIMPVLNASNITQQNTDIVEIEKNVLNEDMDKNIVKKEKENNDFNKDSFEKLNLSNAPPIKDSDLDKFIKEKDSDKNTMNYRIVTPDVLSKVRAAGDTYSVIKLGTYSEDLSTYGKYAWGHMSMYKVNGKIVFCIEYGVDVASIARESYEANSLYNTFSRTKQNEINLTASYAVKKYMETQNSDYLYAAQIIIWDAIKPDEWSINNSSSEIQSEINQIENLKTDHFKLPSFNNKTYTLKYSENTKVYEVTIKDSNNVGSDKINLFVGTYGDYKIIKSGDDLKIITSNPNAKAKEISKSYSVTSEKYNQFYDAGQDLISPSVAFINMNIKLKIEPYFGDLVVNKIGESRENGETDKVKLKDVTFELIQNGKLISKKTTDENGQIVFNNIPNGDYDLIEVETPEGYIPAENIKVTIIAGQVVKLDVLNKAMKSYVEILKTDSEDSEKVLSGAEFQVYKAVLKKDVDTKVEGYEKDSSNYELASEPEVLKIDSNGTKIYSVTSGIMGKAKISNLKYGTYALVETKAPLGYTLSSKIVIFNVDSSLKAVKINYDNEIIKNKIIISKVDATTKTELEGAQICITNTKTNKEIECYISGEQKHEIFVSFGTYKLCEKIAPIGYNLKEECIDFAVDKDGITQNLTIENEVILSGKIILTKTDFKTKEKLEGAEFELLVKNEKGEYISLEHNKKSKFITDKNGTITLNNIKYGEYALREIKAPNGYVVNNKLIKFSVEKDKVDINLEFSNKTVPQIIETGIKYGATVILTLGALIVVLLVVKKKIN